MFECEHRGYCTRDCETCDIAKEQKANEDLNNAIENLKTAVQETLVPYIRAAFEVAKRIVDTFNKFLKCYPNKKVVHLALNSKSERVRKKNLNRIKKDFFKWGRKQ